MSSVTEQATRLHRVWGPPGCGKTTYLAEQARKAAVRFGGDRLIVASLTRAAAAEVAGRDTGIPARNVGTLHAHAYRALGHPALAESKEGLAAWNAQAPPHLRLTGAERDPEWASPEEVSGKTDGDRLLARLGVFRAQLVPSDEWRTAGVRGFAERWEAWKVEAMRLDFTDLIERARLIPHPLDPRVVFLDEAQDMSALEMSLALHWAEDAEQTVIVGDPDQCLFEWRGSSQQAFLGPAAASERVLSQSYRVPEAVHAYAVAWIEHVHDRPPVAYAPRDEPGSVTSCWTTYKQPQRLVSELAATPPGETAMALASCAYMLDPAIKLLRERGVPFHNPYRRTNGRWNPLAGAGRLLALVRPSREVWQGEARWWTWDELRRWLDPLDGKGWLLRGTKSDVEQVCSKNLLGESRKDEVMPLDYLVSMLKGPDAAEAFDALTSKDAARMLAWWAARLRSKEAARFAYCLLMVERFGAASLRETPRVVVGTIHSVKGGEADTVYVFPDLSLAAWTGPEGGWLDGVRDPIYRLFYVAFTRARRALRLCDSSSNLTVPFPRV